MTTAQAFVFYGALYLTMTHAYNSLGDLLASATNNSNWKSAPVPVIAETGSVLLWGLFYLLTHI